MWRWAGVGGSGSLEAVWSARRGGSSVEGGLVMRLALAERKKRQRRRVGAGVVEWRPFSGLWCCFGWLIGQSALSADDSALAVMRAPSPGSCFLFLHSRGSELLRRDDALSAEITKPYHGPWSLTVALCLIDALAIGLCARLATVFHVAQALVYFQHWINGFIIRTCIFTKNRGLCSAHVTPTLCKHHRYHESGAGQLQLAIHRCYIGKMMRVRMRKYTGTHAAYCDLRSWRHLPTYVHAGGHSMMHTYSPAEANTSSSSLTVTFAMRL